MSPARHALLALLAVLLTTAGCTGFLGPSRPPSDQRAVDAVDRSRAAVDAVTSYRVTLDGHVTATTKDDRRTVHLSGDARVNVTAQRMNQSTSTRDTTRLRYIDGYTAYTQCARMGWGKTNLTRSTPWVTHTPLGRQLALFEEANVYWQGTETVDGTETHVVMAWPTKADLRAVDQRTADDTTNLADANIQNMTATMWLDAETGLPVKARQEVRVEQDGATATAILTARFKSYDAPVNVTLSAYDPEHVWTVGCPS